MPQLFLSPSSQKLIQQIKYLIALTSLIMGASVEAHMLNMTRIEVETTTNNRATAAIEIDLGQSLMSAESYWLATQAPANQQAALLEPALSQLDSQLLFLVNDQPRVRHLTSFNIQAKSLDAIRNPLTPQMATLYYELELDQAESLRVQLDENLEIPWPCLLKVTLAGQDLPQSRLLTEVDRLTSPIALNGIGASQSSAQFANAWLSIAPAMEWIAVGFQHIIPRGLDHILFILGLFFLGGGWRPLLLQVTAFTLAHSLTLGLSSYGVVNVPGHIVEPLIALSIVYVALDNLFASQLARWRLLVVMLFGLLHGLGFASVLAEIGLPQESFLTSLALFNLGVELGQLTVLLCAFLIVGWFRRQTWYEGLIANPAAIAIAGTGAYWFLKRIVIS